MSYVISHHYRVLADISSKVQKLSGKKFLLKKFFEISTFREARRVCQKGVWFNYKVAYPPADELSFV